MNAEPKTTDLGRCSRCTEREADPSILCALMVPADYCRANVKTETTGQSCRTCKFLDRGDAKRIQSFHSYRCSAPIPEMPKLPDSVTKAYGFRWPTELSKTYTCPAYGETCPTYEKLKK